jgi:PAS domain S-box-containing protein
MRGIDDHSENTQNSGPDKLFSCLNIPQVAIDAANIGTWVVDEAAKTLLPSKRTKELFGYLPDEEMTLEAAVAQISDKHRQKVMMAIEEAFKKKERFQIEFPVVDFHDQKPRWVSFLGGFIASIESVPYFAGIVVDITEQKRNDLRRSNFIGMVSHELKTPLTALKGYVQLLNNWAKKQKDNFTIGALSKVEKQVKKMLHMINSLLNLSSVEAGKIQLNKQVFALEELINEVIEETLFITSSHDIIMLPCENIQVNADRDKIEQVLVNLLSNAAKYSYQTAPIEIACAVQEDLIMVTVRDQGLGIASGDLEKLFLPHYRVESKETEKVSGFGIGLYLCAEIIERHGGKIWAESELEKGSTFKFTLPSN